jgi:hypothetical protein
VFSFGFAHFLQVSHGFWVFLFTLRSVFAVFGCLKLAALSPNLFREAVHLGFSGFARVYLGFDPGSLGFTWIWWPLNTL